MLIPELLTTVNQVEDAPYDQSDLKRRNDNSRLPQQSQQWDARWLGIRGLGSDGRFVDGHLRNLNEMCALHHDRGGKRIARVEVPLRRTRNAR